MTHQGRFEGRVAVTGSTGFIGTRLVHELVGSGVEVVALHRRETAPSSSQVTFVRADLSNRSSIEAALRDVDVVVHLAARVHQMGELGGDEAHTRETVQATRHVMEAASRAGCRRVVFVSSVAVYGPLGPGCHDEQTPRRPTTAYGRAKAEAEDLLLAAPEPHIVVRPPMVYGPGGKGNLPRMIRLTRRGLFPRLPDTGHARSFVHVANLIDALCACLRAETMVRGAFNVADAVPATARDVQCAIADGLAKPLPRLGPPAWAMRALGRLGDVVGARVGRRLPLDSGTVSSLLDPLALDIARARRELGYAPRHTLESGVREMLESS